MPGDDTDDVDDTNTPGENLEEWADGVPIVPPPDLDAILGEGGDADDTGADAGVPDTDPEHLDPAGDVARLFERGELEASLADGADREALRAFVERAEGGEFDADPGLEAAVRIARALLDEE